MIGGQWETRVRELEAVCEQTCHDRHLEQTRADAAEARVRELEAENARLRDEVERGSCGDPYLCFKELRRVHAAAAALVSQQDTGDGINRDFFDALGVLKHALKLVHPQG